MEEDFDLAYDAGWDDYMDAFGYYPNLVEDYPYELPYSFGWIDACTSEFPVNKEVD